MANWSDLLNEMKSQGSPLDNIRRKYIRELADYTNRNVICYYSNFLSNNNHPDTGINDKDMNGFMTAIHKLDKQKGLDLILHTPGGEVAATEAIGNYLLDFFHGDIRVFIPQMAMSGGTMLSCISKEIYMGKHSSIGPIDPQFGGTPAYGVIQEFENARNEIASNPNLIPLWSTIISKYPPAMVGQCYKAIELSKELVKTWLEKGNMFLEDADKNKKIEEILTFLNNNEYTKLHSRHIGYEKAKQIGLNVIALEDDNDLQDKVLSVHHCYMHVFDNSPAIKIIENNIGGATVLIAQ